MSIYNTFRERFKAENISADYFCEKTECSVGDLVATMQSQIALLCSRLICDDEIGYVNILIDADGKKTEYSSKASNGILTAEIQEAIINLVKSEKLEVSLEYDYVWRVWKDYLSVGPFVMAELLRECDDEIFNYIDYAMYDYADCSDGAGIVSVYGKRNGVIHRGAVDYSVTEAIPSFGRWDERLSVVVEDDDIRISEENIQCVTELCHELLEMCFNGTNTFSIDNNVLCLTLNGPFLASPETIKKFAENLSALAALINCPPDESPDDIFCAAEFFDDSDTGPNLLKIEITYSGEAIISTALAF